MASSISISVSLITIFYNPRCSLFESTFQFLPYNYYLRFAIILLAWSLAYPWHILFIHIYIYIYIELGKKLPRSSYFSWYDLPWRHQKVQGFLSTFKIATCVGPRTCFSDFIEAIPYMYNLTAKINSSWYLLLFSIHSPSKFQKGVWKCQKWLFF